MIGSQQQSNACKGSMNTSCPTYKAFFRVTPDRRVRIFFVKRELTAKVIRCYFGSGQFFMSDSFELPVELLKSLGLDYYKINSGAYPVLEDNEYIMVDV